MADEWDAEEDEEEDEATLLTSLAAAAPPPATGAAPATHAAPCGASGVGTLAEPSLSAATSSPSLALDPCASLAPSPVRITWFDELIKPPNRNGSPLRFQRSPVVDTCESAPTISAQGVLHGGVKGQLT